MRTMLLAAALGLIATATAQAEIKTKTVTYTYDGTTLKGFLAWDDAVKGPRPGVLVLHEWWGLNDYARARTRQLAGLGYVAFAGDLYGEGKTVAHPKEAGQMAAALRNDLKTWQGRARAALKILQDDDKVDGKRLGAIGYCFGGSTALQLAYTGAPLQGVVTFHAALPVPRDDRAKAIQPRLLICHGAADPFVTEEVAAQFRAALERANVTYEMIYFGGAKHSFTVAGIDKLGVKGLSYNAAADNHSWHAMRHLFAEAFGQIYPPPARKE